MKEFFRFHNFTVLIVLILTACSSQSTQQPQSDQETGSETPTAQTKIVIDGNNDDWGNYPVTVQDPAGDQKGGGSDLGDVKVFINDQYLFVLINFRAKGADDEIHVEFTLADESIARLIFDTQSYLIQIRNPTTTAPQDIRNQVFWGDSLEIKIPLTEFGHNPVSVNSVKAKLNMLDSADNVSGGSIFVTNEIDGVQFVESHNQPPPPTDPEDVSLSEYFSLPDNYEARLLYSPPAPDQTAITKSQDGTIFLQHGSLNAGISTLNYKTKEVSRIFDLEVGAQVSYIVGGPGDAVFITIYGEGIFLVHADGSSQLWSPDRGMVLFYTQDGRAFGTDLGKTIVTEYFEGGGSSNTIATGFTYVYDLVVTAGETMYVSDFQSGDIIRVEPSGEKTVLAEQLTPFDPMDIALREGNRLYVSTAFHGLIEVDTEEGGYAVEYPQGSTCALRDGDFIFLEQDLVMFTDPGAGLVTMLDLISGSDDLIIGNLAATRAATIGPDQQLYFGIRGCPGISNAQVVRMDQDGNIEVVIDGLVGEITHMAFDNNGGLYLALHQVGVHHNLYYYQSLESAGKVVAGAEGMHTFAVNPLNGNLFGIKYDNEMIYEITPEGVLRFFGYSPPEDTVGNALAISGSGQLYVQGLEADTLTTGPSVQGWIFKVDYTTGQAEEFYSFTRQGALPFRVLTADPNGNVWWVINPEFIVKRIEPDGSDLLFAQNLPIDSPAIAVDENENVYIFSPGGIFGFFRTD